MVSSQIHITMFKIQVKNQVQFTTQELQLCVQVMLLLREQPTLVQQAMSGVQLIPYLWIKL